MLQRKRTLLAAATTCAVLAIPAVASAKDFCVGGPAGCTGTPVAANGLAAALTAAGSNGTDDRFLLAPGVFSSAEFSHQSGERLQLIGAGAGKTILRGDAGDSVLTLGGNQDSAVSDLTLEPIGAASSALTLLGTRSHGVAVDAKGVASLVTGVRLFGDSTFDDGSVDLHAIQQPAVTVFSGAGSVTDSTLTAPAGAGVVSGGNAATVRRSTLDARIGAAALAGHLTVSDTLVDLRGHADTDPAFGVLATVSTDGTTATADADRLTIVGSTGTAFGVAAVADGAAASAEVHLRDSVINGVVPVGRQAQNGGTARITTDRSAYTTVVAGPDIGPGAIVETNRLKVAPRFVGAGDFRLAADSQLIDAGTRGTLPAGAADRDGRPRASDGNGDCARVPDIGAFEYQGTRVRAVATAGAATAGTGQQIRFSAAGSCIPGPGAATVAWRFDDGAGATGPVVTHAFATPGRHTATVSVSDRQGHHAQGSAAVDVTTPAATAASPRISRLRVAPRRVQIGTRLPRLVRRAARRPLSTIRFKLSERATVTLRFAKVGKHGGTHALERKLRVKARKGRNRIRFAARLTRTAALRPGTYRITAVATGRAGVRSKRARARFTAVKPTRR